MFILLIAMPLKPNRQRVHVTLLGKLFGTIIGIKNATFESSLFD